MFFNISVIHWRYLVKNKFESFKTDKSRTTNLIFRVLRQMLTKWQLKRITRERLFLVARTNTASVPLEKMMARCRLLLL